MFRILAGENGMWRDGVGGGKEGELVRAKRGFPPDNL